MSRCKVLPRTVRLSAAFLKQTMCFRRKVRDARLSRSLLNGAAGCQLQQVARRDDARQVRPRKHVRHFFLPPTSSEGHRRQQPSPASRRSRTSTRTSCFIRFFPTRGPALPYVSGLQCPRFVGKSPAQLGGLVRYRLTVDGSSRRYGGSELVTELTRGQNSELNC